MIPAARCRRTTRVSYGRVFAMPLILVLATLAGLISVLTGDGGREWLGLLLTALPLLALVLAWARRG